MVEQLKNFIKDNNLKFSEGSGGDINILAICGYSVYKKVSLEDCILQLRLIPLLSLWLGQALFYFQ